MAILQGRVEVKAISSQYWQLPAKAEDGKFCMYLTTRENKNKNKIGVVGKYTPSTVGGPTNLQVKDMDVSSWYSGVRIGTNDLIYYICSDLHGGTLLWQSQWRMGWPSSKRQQSRCWQGSGGGGAL